MLYFQLDEEKGQCCFWAYGKDKLEECQGEGFRKMADIYRKKGYEIIVFIGGERPLLPVMKELFHAQEKEEKQNAIEAS